MNAIKALKLAGTVLIVMASFSAYAQPASSGASAPNASSAAPSAKSIRAANRQLAKNVRRALAKTKGLSTVNVTVRANRGVVTLEGAVPDSGQVDKAGQVAQGVAGVTSVKNDLTTMRQAQ